ncbi:MAG: TonB-dependent receptor [Gammaproteobacteria bacterium]|nr:TonB-dependent receptor [Gammaproteobacteria bacterium]
MNRFTGRFGISGKTLLWVFAAVSAMLSVSVSAQEITASINGTVLAPNGQPASGVMATITDNRDGRRQTTTTDARGVVNFRSIKAGGPYTIRLTGSGFEDQVITDVYTNVAGTSTFSVTLAAASAEIEEITVTAAQIQMITTASGPSSTFTLDDVTNMPSTTRQIRDVIRLDPRVSIGETGSGGDQSGAISCLGGSSRTNSFTIDGVRATDAFGLNLSGNLSRFTFPIPFDTVAAAAVEFAPVSVEYGQFSGCNVNVVTKSGENEFHGSGFWLYNDDGMTGDKINGDPFDQGTFERENYGVEFSGPILKDKLFFYASYEKFDTATVNQFGSADDTSFPRNDTAFTTAELDRIRNILINQYGRDPGEVIRNLPVESERYFARIDWNINDSHRLEGTYASVEEATRIGDDIGSGRGEFTFSDNFHARGSDSETFGIRLFSDWTDSFSTEFRWSTQEVIDSQNPVGGGEQQDEVPKPRIAVSDGSTAGVFGGEFFGQEFVSGPGTFRSANALTTEKDQFKLKADWQVGDHLITGGYEYETLDVFNLFIINATGTVFFDSIDNLELGQAYEIRQNVSFTLDPTDAAAIYTRDIHSLFLQDRWTINDSMELIFGLRYDWYDSNDLPLLNQTYVDRYGMTNQVGMDGLDAIQPRIGFNMTMPDSWGDTRLSLGFGVFSGNDPTVWFSNAYQNFGGAIGLGTVTGIGSATTCTGAELNVLAGGSFSGIPACVSQSGQNQALASLAAVNATDPNLELPTANRYSLGLEHNTSLDNDFFSDWNLRLDLIYTDLKDQVDFVDLSMTQTGTLPDGRPSFTPVDPLRANCNATFNGVRQGFSNVTPDCFGANQDIYFTNKQGDGGYTFTTSIQANKGFNWGDTWALGVNVGYSYNESEVGNPGNSFTASGNHRSVVYRELENPTVGPSYRNTPHNFVLSMTLSNYFFGDNKTSLTAFFQRRKGNPLSIVHFGTPYADIVGDQSDEARYLLYVPTGPSDPLVTWTDGSADAFFDYADRIGLKRGQIAPKGVLDEPWQSDLDLRFQQEIPFFMESKAKIYFDVENVLNLISDSSGTKAYVDTTDILSAVGIVNTDLSADGTQYEYSGFSAPTTTPDSWDTLWRVQLGLRVDF